MLGCFSGYFRDVKNNVKDLLLGILFRISIPVVGAIVDAMIFFRMG